MRIHGNRRTAFTLVELIASALLAAMMMAALLSITWSALRESNQLRRSATNQFPVTHLVDQMRCDFVNARGMSVDEHGLTLHGFLGQDPRTTEPLLVPGQVRYEIRPTNEGNFLTRAASGNRAQAVWRGISRLQVVSLADPDPQDEVLPEPETGGLPELPLTFRVTLVGDRRKVLWREVIHHHEN